MPHSGNRHGYRKGDFYRICDRTGLKVWASETRRTWDGLIVAKDQWEPKHPQENVRAKADRQAVPDPRPRAADRNVYPEGGPFFLVFTNEFGQKSIQVSDGQFYAYNGEDSPSPSDL